MKRVNKVLVLFVFLLSLFLMITWEVMQSEFVATRVSKAITIYTKKFLNADIQFQDLNFELFPPGVALEGVSFEIERKVSIQAKVVRGSFRIEDIFSTKLGLSELRVDDFVVNIKSNNSKKKTKKEKVFKPQELIQDVEELPIKSLYLTNFDLRYNDKSIKGKALKLIKKFKHIKAFGSIQESQNIHKELEVIDSLDFEIGWVDDQLQIQNLKLMSGFSYAFLAGKIKNIFAKPEMNLRGYADFPLRMISDKFLPIKWGKVKEGDVESKYEVKGTLDDIKASSDVSLENVKSDFVDFKSAKLNVKLNDKEITAENLNIHAGAGTAQVKKLVVYNFDSKEIIPFGINVNADNLSSKTFLRYIQKSTSFLDLAITGKVKIDRSQDGIVIVNEDEVAIHKFAIVLNEKSDLFRFKKNINLSSAKVIIGKPVVLQFQSITEGDDIKVNGIIENGKTNLDILASNLNLNDISPFINEKIKGQANIDLNLSNRQNDLSLQGKVEVNEFVIRDQYNIEKAGLNLNYNISKNFLDFNKVKLQQEGAIVRGNASLDVSQSKFYSDYQARDVSLDAIHEFFSSLEMLPNVLHEKNNWIGGAAVEGELVYDFNDGKYKINGNVLADGINIYKEKIDNLLLEYELSDKALLIKNGKLSKGKGNVDFNVFWDIKKDSLKFNTSVDSIQIDDFNLYGKIPLDLEAKAKGRAHGELYKRRWSIFSKFDFYETQIINNKYPDSYLLVEVKNGITSFKTDIFNKQITAQAKLQDKNFSEAEIWLNIPEINKFSKIFSGIDKFEKLLEGSLKLQAQSKFNLTPFTLNDLIFNIEEAIFSKSSIAFDYRSLEPEIIIENSKLSKWDVDIDGNDFYIKSKAEGKIDKDFTSTTYLKTDASILEVFNNIINKSNGVLRSKLIFSDKKGVEKVSFESSNLAIEFKDYPVQLSEGNFKVEYQDMQLNLEQAKAKVGNGNIHGKGVVDFSNIFPKIDIDFMLDNTSIPVLGRSEFSLSGAGNIYGERFPYKIKSELYIKDFLISNDITEFSELKGGAVKKSIYLPEKNQKEQNQILEIDIDVRTQDPIILKNSLVNVGMQGEVNITGGENQIFLNGGFDLASRKNLIKLRSTEFLLDKGSIRFKPDKKITNPDIDFQAKGSINNYEITIKTLGDIRDYNPSFSSEPALSQNDILSLIAFGYAGDASQDLSNSERETLTQAGVGAIIFDRFKINETLQKEFGLKINLGTQITQDTASYLSRKSAEGDGAENKTKSATTFEVSKKITDKVDLSVSSTIGGSATQKQTMNLNYNMTENLSLEGIYESKNDDDAESIDDDSAIGADLKWKWSFK